MRYLVSGQLPCPCKNCYPQYLKSPKCFCFFDLKTIIFSRMNFWHKYILHYKLFFYVAIKFPLEKRVKTLCNSANFWSKYEIFICFEKTLFWFQYLPKKIFKQVLYTTFILSNVKRAFIFFLLLDFFGFLILQYFPES